MQWFSSPLQWHLWLWSSWLRSTKRPGYLMGCSVWSKAEQRPAPCSAIIRRSPKSLSPAVFQLAKRYRKHSISLRYFNQVHACQTRKTMMSAVIPLRSWKCQQKGWSRWLWSLEENHPSLSSKTASWRTQWRERSWQTFWHRDRLDYRISFDPDPRPHGLTRWNMSNIYTGVLQWHQGVCAARDIATVSRESGQEDQSHPAGWSPPRRHTYGSSHQQTPTGKGAGVHQSGKATGMLTKNIPHISFYFEICFPQWFAFFFFSGSQSALWRRALCPQWPQAERRIFHVSLCTWYV